MEKSPQEQCLHTVLSNFNMGRAQFGTRLYEDHSNGPKNEHRYGAALGKHATHCRGFARPNFSVHPRISQRESAPFSPLPPQRLPTHQVGPQQMTELLQHWGVQRRFHPRRRSLAARECQKQELKRQLEVHRQLLGRWLPPCSCWLVLVAVGPDLFAAVLAKPRGKFAHRCQLPHTCLHLDLSLHVGSSILFVGGHWSIPGRCHHLSSDQHVAEPSAVGQE